MPRASERDLPAVATPEQTLEAAGWQRGSRPHTWLDPWIEGVAWHTEYAIQKLNRLEREKREAEGKAEDEQG